MLLNVCGLLNISPLGIKKYILVGKQKEGF